ncbi:MAG: FmdB family zinc ribbon protein [Gammaproteobacteria bacterium]
MPTYDYRCNQCGDFELRRPMSESSAPARCPHCQADARRLIAAPYLATMNPHTRIACARNEKSADAPRVMSREQLHQAGQLRGHLHSHAHGHRDPRLARAGVGEDWVRSSRPSMLGH